MISIYTSVIPACVTLAVDTPWLNKSTMEIAASLWCWWQNDSVNMDWETSGSYGGEDEGDSLLEIGAL
jgi:hypothetical protein